MLPAGVHGLRIELKMMSTATAGWGDNIAKFDNISITFDCETQPPVVSPPSPPPNSNSASGGGGGGIITGNTTTSATGTVTATGMETTTIRPTPPPTSTETQAPSPNTPTEMPTAAPNNSDNSASEARGDNSSSSTGTTVAITLVVLLILAAAVFFVIRQRRQVDRKQSSGPSSGSVMVLRAVDEGSITVSPSSTLGAVANSAYEGEGMLATKALPSYSIADYGGYDNGRRGGNGGADYRVPNDNTPVVDYYAAATGPSPSTAGQHGKLDGSQAQDGKITKVYGSVHGSHRPIDHREASANFC
jgi:hypothetical protein